MAFWCCAKCRLVTAYAPGGIRTHDLLVKSQLLYQLSYRSEVQRYLMNVAARNPAFSLMLAFTTDTLTPIL